MTSPGLAKALVQDHSSPQGARPEKSNLYYIQHTFRRKDALLQTTHFFALWFSLSQELLKVCLQLDTCGWPTSVDSGSQIVKLLRNAWTQTQTFTPAILECHSLNPVSLGQLTHTNHGGLTAV